MSGLVLDAGAFIAADRGSRPMMARLGVAQQAGVELRTTGVVVAQVWRDPGARPANLARLFKSVDVKAVDEQLGKEAGVLMGRAGTNDAVDASVVVVAETGDRILTSGAGGIGTLVKASGRTILVVPC